MIFSDSITSAGKSLWAKKLRSFLSILGIVIGIFTISSLLTIAFSVRTEIQKSIGDLGANLVFVLPGKVDEGGGFGAQLGASTLTERDVDAIRASVPDAQNLSTAMLVNGTVKAGDKRLTSAMIFAASPGADKALNVKIQTGRLTDAGDEASHAKNIVLGDHAAKDLFGTSEALGKTVDIRGLAFQVVGVLQEASANGSFGGPDMNGIVMMPLQTGWEITNTKQIFRIFMQAPSADRVVGVKDTVKAAILATHGGEEDFTVFTQDDLLGMVNQILNLITAMVGAITGISLVVGGIGIMNIMLVTVSERTKEIGIRKAVGATRTAILLQFLVESMMLTFVAGVVAVAMFTALVAVISNNTSLPVTLDFRVIGIALAFSGVVGIIFGIIPALQASRKDPIVALRSE
jgi:putative ABC transport system permease protein